MRRLGAWERVGALCMKGPEGQTFVDGLNSIETLYELLQGGHGKSRVCYRERVPNPRICRMCVDPINRAGPDTQVAFVLSWLQDMPREPEAPIRGLNLASDRWQSVVQLLCCWLDSWTIVVCSASGSSY